MARTQVVCIGAGPAGLTAAYLLSKRGIPVTVFEADPNLVGGISRTINYKGFRFDIGGHRFFSKSQEVEDLWTELLPDDLLQRPRSSRIYYRGRFFSYPLKALEALFGLGVWEATLCVLSYLWARMRPVPSPQNVEEWVSNQFGKRLFRIFFKTYTEKVWGLDCRKISADWASQRIKGFSLGQAIWHAIIPRRRSAHRKDVIKTMIDSFRYPRLGPGMMWEAAARKFRENGGTLKMGHKITALRHLAEQKLWEVQYTDDQGVVGTIITEHVVSSAPIRELFANLEPRPRCREATARLEYRDFISVSLIVKDRMKLKDNWIYIHDPQVLVGRIQNFKSWSESMVPDPSLNCYGLEYFCFEGDGLWNRSDRDLIELASSELVKLGLAESADVVDGKVVRQPKAYPVYDGEGHYQAIVQEVRAEMDERYPGLHLVGRNGMHKYNNQDHAMMTAMLTVENIVAGRNVYDVWNVNQDAEYLEAGSQSDMLRAVPTAVRTKGRDAA